MGTAGAQHTEIVSQDGARYTGTYRRPYPDREAADNGDEEVDTLPCCFHLVEGGFPGEHQNSENSLGDEGWTGLTGKASSGIRSFDFEMGFSRVPLPSGTSTTADGPHLHVDLSQLRSAGGGFTRNTEPDARPTGGWWPGTQGQGVGDPRWP